MVLLTLKKLSRKTSISVYTLRKFANNGMPHCRIGNKIYVHPVKFQYWFIENYSYYNDEIDDVDIIVKKALASLN
jgi:hypothetical protein